MNYYLTVYKGEEEMIRRILFEDYNDALLALLDYYKPKYDTSVLPFTTDVIKGQFARSSVELNLPEDIEEIKNEFDQQRYNRAAKNSNSFEYDASYYFLIESEIGIKDTDAFFADDDEDDD